MSGGNPTVLMVLVFLLVLLLVVGGAMLFGGLDGTRAALQRRIDKLRERLSPDQEVVARVRALRLRGDDPKTAFEAALRGLVPRPAELRRRLNATGRSITISQYVSTCLVTLVMVIALSMVIFGAPFLLAFLLSVVIGVGLPHMVVGFMIKKRITTFTKMFPDAIDLIVRGLRSGLPVSQSIGAVGREFPDPIGVEFRGVIDKVKLGKSLEAALWQMAERITTADFKFFVITLAIQRETGGNLAETLGGLSDILRKRQQLKLKIKAMSSEAKASAYIVGALPFIMFGILLMMNYSYASTMFTDPRAMMAGIGGLIWMGIGVMIMAKMINFEI